MEEVITPPGLSTQELKEKCSEVRKHIVKMVHSAGSGHPGGSLSSVELMVGLFFNIIKDNPENPEWKERDYFILSKGHVCPVLYAVWAEKGYFPKEELLTLRQFGSRLQGHPCKSMGLPGIELSSGSLGQGLSVANVISMGLKSDGLENQVYCLLGDGELQEGQIWEAAMTAPHYNLDNVCAIVDYNKLQIDGNVEDVMGIASLKHKWESFNWHVIEIEGHELSEVLAAYQEARYTIKKPSVILAHTIKGKGISYMENEAGWHGKAPNNEELNIALNELSH